MTDFAALGVRWRDLEQRAAGSFFQSWTWVGCLARDRFPAPVLVEAIDSGRTVALALFNRRRHWTGLSTLYLHESGTAELDCPYVEQNGVLTEAGREAELTVLCLHAVAQRCHVVLSGVAPAHLGATRQAARLVAVRREQAAPFADLASIRRTGSDVLAGCSANTRQQIRRSDRFYARLGAIRVTHPASVDEAHSLLDEMAALHQATWQARDQPGSFARPFFRRFHRELIARGHPRGEVIPLRISAGEVTIGVLYQFVWAGRMLAYQSGFAYQPGPTPAKPGLTCHHSAMHHALSQGLDSYDFLAGESRYKRSLSDHEQHQIWAEAGPWWRPTLWLGRLKG